MDYTVIIAEQTPADQKKYPWGYKYDRPQKIDLRQLDNQQLNKLYLDAQSIYTQLQEVLMERG